ncbi:hypothetical protein TSUD_171000 [Trifolium subterraneum]|uniref:Leucine-rich repeat-containing N-terminal plant-type domain-containing protein n=1 Tax=Trifolium subterraneum TaxID=3900 RepID=A0A2Z6LPI1_TRISU|nr:hypothetical protein TSUD_171000 [Trifolium subterraneum]
MTCNEKEKNALLNFKHGLSDPSKRLSSWSNEHDCCRWMGVQCDNITGRVIELNLSTPLDSPYMELSGEISPSLLELKSLIHLDLSLNYFVNTKIPSFFGSMERLTYLDLSLSGFMGLIPHQLGPKFPAWLKTQSFAKVLTMSNSGISDFAPRWFWNWTLQIEFLDLSNNFISGDLSNMFLNSSIINLSSNHFKGRLPSVSANVEVLNIANNSISGPISSPFLCEGMRFDNKLTVLDVSNNMLSGDLGHCWIQWQNLIHLNLGSNNFSGEIPNSIGHLLGLESLILDDNDFYGNIPSSLQNCSVLKFIDFGNNKLSGTLPSWIWEMQYLMVLRLRSNEFKGSITQKMCQLSSLIVLDIANNSLSGTIPFCVDEMKTMAGEDDFFANPLKYYYGFGFNYNNYKESLVLVPKGDELEYRDNLILVRMIDLSSNNLFGTIPFQISKLTTLRFLNLSRNRLNGEIPNDMGNMKLLESLDLSLNKISGKIPTSTQLQSFEVLSYTGNPELCGPPLMNNCTKVEQVLENGNFDGSFIDTSDFYIGMGVGFAAGFWGICIAIFFSRTCRHAFFHFFYHLKQLI